MIIKKKRIKLTPDSLSDLQEEMKAEYGSCTKSAVFSALSFISNSAKASVIRDMAIKKYNGVIITEEKVYD